MRLEEMIESSPSSVIIEEDDVPVGRSCVNCLNWEQRRNYGFCGLYASADVPMPRTVTADNCHWYDTGYDDEF